jgi:hypothetical protein
MAARNRPPNASTFQLGTKAREHIDAGVLINRLKRFVLIDPDHPKPGDIRLTRTQAFIALALLKKVLPDLASVEVSGNPEKPLIVQVVRFSDGEQLTEPRPVLDMSKLIEMEKAETAAIETEAAGRSTGRKTGREQNGHGN